MGCCETRETLPRAPREGQKIALGQMGLVTISGYQPIQRVFDQPSQALLEYVHTLLDSAEWNAVYTEDWFELETLQHSAYRENLQVSKFCLKFNQCLDSEIVFEMLNSPELRMEWDTSIAQMNIEEGDLKSCFTAYRVMSRLSFKRDFLEKKFVGADEGSLVSIAYSVEGKESKITRGYTYFSYLRVIPVKGTTQVVLVNQTDTQLPTQTFAKLACVQMKSWAKTFFKQLIKAHPKPNNEQA